MRVKLRVYSNAKHMTPCVIIPEQNNPLDSVELCSKLRRLLTKNNYCVRITFCCALMCLDLD